MFTCSQKEVHKEKNSSSRHFISACNASSSGSHLVTMSRTKSTHQNIEAGRMKSWRECGSWMTSLGC